jgi:hypothetical protein
MGKGPKEIELEAIVHADKWEISSLPNLKASLDAVVITMQTIAAGTGTKGAIDDSARAHFLARAKEFSDMAKQVSDVSDSIDAANAARDTAAHRLATLPSATVPSWVHDTVKNLGSIPIPIPIIGPLSFLTGVAGNEAVNLAQGFLEQQREAAAQSALDEMKPKLVPPTLGNFSQIYPGDSDGSSDGQSTDGDGDGSSGGSVPGRVFAPSHSSGKAGGTSGGLTGFVPDPNDTVPPPVADGQMNGTDPNGSISTSGGGIGSEGSGGSSGAGILGGLAAGGAGLAALSAGGRFGGGGLTGAGTPSLGSGGLLGASGKGGAAAAAAEPEGTAAGAKPGTSMMGGSGGAGSRGKEKRAGLGGFIAPKLEDDEEFVPRSSGAFAGSRDSGPKE